MTTKRSIFLLLVLMLGGLSQSHANDNPISFFTPVHPIIKALATGVKTRTRGLVSKPGSQKNYTWMDTAGTFGYWQNNNDGLGVLIHNTNEFFTYDVHGNTLEDRTTDTTGANLTRYQYTYNWTTITISLLQAWDGGNWVDSMQTLYTYDSVGRSLTVLDQSWNGGSWDNLDLSSQEYDRLGNPSTGYFMSWGSTSWDTVIGIKDVFQYDANNHIIGDSLLQYQGFGQWVNAEKLTYTVDGTGAWQSLTAQLWSSALGWVNVARLYDATWYNFNAQEPYGYIQQSYSTGAWKDSLQLTATYDNYGGSVQTTQLKPNATWVNGTRTSLIYDTHSNFIEELDESWFQSGWIMADQYNYDYTYDINSNVTRIIFRNWTDNTEPAEEVNWQRTDFADFQEIDVSGVKNINADTQVSVYPNPSINQVNISISDPNFKVASISIFNFLGQNVTGTDGVNTSSSNISIPVNELPAGIYFVRLTGTDQSRVTEKFVKE